jgi:hypothetical protein
MTTSQFAAVKYMDGLSSFGIHKRTINLDSQHTASSSNRKVEHFAIKALPTKDRAPTQVATESIELESTHEAPILSRLPSSLRRCTLWTQRVRQLLLGRDATSQTPAFPGLSAGVSRMNRGKHRYPRHRWCGANQLTHKSRNTCGLDPSLRRRSG